MVYIVIYGDYDCPYDVVGVFANEKNAEKCLEYYKKLTANNHYGNTVEIVKMSYEDDTDYNAKIFELEENKRREKQAKEDAIKQKDLEEFNRIKEKYGL